MHFKKPQHKLWSDLIGGYVNFKQNDSIFVFGPGVLTPYGRDFFKTIYTEFENVTIDLATGVAFLTNVAEKGKTQSFGLSAGYIFSHES